MSPAVAFPFLLAPGPLPIFRPLVPLTLRSEAAAVAELGLVDSGSDTSVLPYSLGMQLGLDWNKLPVLPAAGGILGSSPTRGVILDGEIKPFAPIRLAFSWVQRDDIPLILGQVNFFLEFDVCFFRSRGEFQIQPATP